MQYRLMCHVSAVTPMREKMQREQSRRSVVVVTIFFLFPFLALGLVGLHLRNLGFRVRAMENLSTTHDVGGDEDIDGALLPAHGDGLQHICKRNCFGSGWTIEPSQLKEWMSGSSRPSGPSIELST